VKKRTQRLLALIRKETTQLLRDRRSLVFIVSMPLLQLFLYGYAVSLTVYHLPTAVVDQSRDQKSRDFIHALVNSQYFDVVEYLQSEDQVVQAIDAGRVKAGVVIPPEFGTDIERRRAHVLVLLDGSDSFSTSSGAAAASTVAQDFSLQMLTRQIRRQGGGAGLASAITTPPINSSIRVLYNPDMVDLWFILPAIVGMIMQTTAVTQAALTVVREREVGTMEQILVTPTRPYELILGKMVPLLGLIFTVTGMVIGFGVFWFGVPFQGNLVLYFFLAFLFVASSLGLGLLISTVARTQRQAQQMSLMLMLFALLLTGLLYPRASMPLIPRLIGSMIPLTYFVRISRGIMIKGVGLGYFMWDALALVFFAVVVIWIASRSFNERLD
jgi:ABC-2 type transport system permease protein